MKNKLLFIFFVFLMAPIYGQYLYVEYEHTVNVVKETGSFKMNAILVAEDNLSHYTVFFNNDKFKNISNVIKDENDDSSFHVFTSLDVGDSSTLIYNKVDNGISLNLLDRGKPIIIQDNGVEFDWKFSDETKTIQNFECTKATVDFRGRQYIVWFTTDIPVSFGPWKFHGLPGLILEVYDVDHLFEWSATKIQYPVQLVKTLDAVHSGANFKVMSLRDYLKAQSEKRTEDEKMRLSKLSKGTRIVESKTENKGIELVYEWELAEGKKN